MVIDDNLKGPPVCRIKTMKGVCVYEWRYMTAEVFVDYVLAHPKPAMQVVLFLVPEIAEYIGLRIDQLPKLQPLIDALDPRHVYAAIIYRSYLQNGSFILTDAQLHEAYKNYQEARS